MALDHQHPLGSFACARESNTGATVFGRDTGIVQERAGPVQRACLSYPRPRSPPDALPDAQLAPAFEPPPHRRRRALLARQLLPAAARDEHVHDAFDGPPVVCPRPPSSSRQREEKSDEVPLPLGAANSAHASRLVHWVSVSEPSLRNLFEHFDERLDLWARTSPRRILITRSIGYPGAFNTESGWIVVVCWHGSFAPAQRRHPVGLYTLLAHDPTRDGRRRDDHLLRCQQ
jgi:hypothetical protein